MKLSNQHHPDAYRPLGGVIRSWGTEDYLPPRELVATQCMVRLPLELRCADVPGQPGGGLRDELRLRFSVEAAIGNFAQGGYVRLSYAVYNTQEDVERLKDAVLQLLREQSRGT